MPYDVFEYLTNLDQERYRAIIIHTRPELSALMSNFAKKVCEQTGGVYLDLLNMFIQTSHLREGIDGFSPEKFRNLIMEHSKANTLIFLDRVDFILDTWRRNERQSFFRMVADQWDGYKEGMRAKLVICLQTSHEVKNAMFYDSQQRSRIFELSDFNDI